VSTLHERAEKVNGKFDFITGRAVETIPEFYDHVKHLLRHGNNSPLANGILYLKGGDFSEELTEFKKEVKQFSLSDYFAEEFFETKKLAYIPF
jgi:16S rRNA (guanine527-N7)-methyltransferase